MSRMTTSLRKIFAEARRRKVLGIAVGYVVVGWLAVEVAATIFPIFNAPDWVLKVVASLVFLGFPVAIVLAWAYDVTPGGVTRTGAAMDGQQAISAQDGIAVLPFVSMSQDVDDEHLADGIAEEIINALTHIPGLKVAARTSAFSFKGTNTDLKQVGAKLGVGRVLEGSLRRAGSQLRVTAQLVNVGDGYHLWSERYDRELVDIFAIQDDIAQAITTRISGAERGEPSTALDTRQFTDNVQAYESYLKGKWCWARAGEHFERGIELVDEARKLDPKFAQAHAWYAIMQVYLVFFGYAKGTDCVNNALQAAERAMECNDQLADSQIAIGIVRQYFFFDWTATEKHYGKALELVPGDAVAAAWLAVYLTRFPDRYEESLKHARRAASLDPLSADHNAILSWILWNYGEYDESSEILESIQEMHPLYPLGYAFAGAVRTSQGRHDEAVALYENAPELARNDPMYQSFYAFSLGKAGRKEEAMKRIARMEEVRESGYFGAGYLCVASLGVGDMERALDWAETAVNEVDSFFTYAGTCPPFADLQTEPRFRAVLKRMNL